MVVRRWVHAEAMGVVGSAMAEIGWPTRAVLCWEMGLWGEMRGCGYYCEVASSQVIVESFRFASEETRPRKQQHFEARGERAQACQGELVFSASFLQIVVCKLRLTSKRA